MQMSINTNLMLKCTMALLYWTQRAIFIVILLASCGSLNAEELTEEAASSDNTTQPVTREDNTIPDNDNIESAMNQLDNVTENTTDKPTGMKITTQEVVENTQNTTQSMNPKTTQKSYNNTEIVLQSSNKVTIGMETEKNTQEPGGVTSEKDHSESRETNNKSDITTQFVPVTFDTRWMDMFINTHHFEGQYLFNNVRYLFDFVVRYKHPENPRTLVTNLYDADGAELEFNGTSSDSHIIVFTLSKIYTPGVRFPLHQPLEITGSFTRKDQPYFTGNFTKPVNSLFAWFRMNKGLGTIETGETAGTKTAIVIIIPTSIAFLGLCSTVAIICWASKKGYLRGRHKSYRLFTDAQVSYESEAETIHI